MAVRVIPCSSQGNLFITCDLFNDADSISGCFPSDRMINELERI
jgi:hypothetical protein